MSHAEPVLAETDARVLLFTDLVDSTDLKRRLGDEGGAEAIARHDRVFRELLPQFGGVLESDKGDGFFAFFVSPADAVRFALAFNRALAGLDLPVKLQVRIGIHMGEILRIGGGEGAPLKPVGLAVDTAARVMSLCQGGQILLTRAAFNLARPQVLADEGGSAVRWLAHGDYLFRGLAEPIEIFEVGLLGRSPLAPPPSSPSARRTVVTEDEDILGWRPAAGLHVPHREGWVLRNQLGLGGFGETWLAEHEPTKEKRVFKFCFEPNRIRGLKREVVLVRLLKEALGDRRDIARIIDWQFDDPPYFLESEYTDCGDLIDWANARGGIAQVPLETRLAIVAQACHALAAAHSVGVLHKDVKPANILIVEDQPGGEPRAVLTDFGIGLVVDRKVLSDKGITTTGLTQTFEQREGSSGSGTRLYMAPEVLEGKPATTLSDVYAMGIVLYQMAIGDFSKSLAPGWEREIEDPLLREDIAACVDGSPERRIESLTLLAERLATLEERRERAQAERRTREESERAKAQAARARRRRKILYAVSAAGLLIAVAGALVAVEQSRLRRRADEAREAAELALKQMEAERARADERAAAAEYEQYVSSILFADSRIRAGVTDASVEAALLRTPAHLRNFEWGYLMLQIRPELALAGRTPEAESGGSGAAPSALRLWEDAIPAEVTRFTGHSGPVMCADIGPDGKLAVTGSLDQTAIVWELETGKEVLRLGAHEGNVTGVDFSSDGKLIATASSDRMARIWDAKTGALLHTLEGHVEAISSVEFSPDNRKIVTASWDDTAKVWDRETGAELLTLAGHTMRLWKATFSPDGGRIATASDDGDVRIWDSATGEMMTRLRAHANGVSEVSFSADGTRVLTGSPDAMGYVFDLETRQRTHHLRGHVSLIASSRFSRSGAAALTGSWDNSVRLWDIAAGREALVISGHGDHVNEALFSPDQKRIVTASADGTARVWKAVRAPTSGALAGHSNDVVYAAFSPDGRYAGTAGRDRMAFLWDAFTGQPLRRLAGHDAMVKTAIFSPDSSKLVTASWDGTARIWPVKSQAEPIVLAGHTGPVIYASFDPEGKRVLTISWDSTARIWDAVTGETIREMTMAGAPDSKSPFTPDNSLVQHAWMVNGEFDKSGERLVTGSFGGDAMMWDAQTGERIFTLEGHTASVYHAQFSPDGSRIVTCSVDNTARLWDSATGKEVVVLRGFLLFSPAFSPDGKRIAISSAMGGPRVFDTATGETLLTIAGHRETVMGARFSPDGTRLLTCSTDGTTRLWDAGDGRELLTLRKPESVKADSVLMAQFSPDGQSIIVGERYGGAWITHTLGRQQMGSLGERMGGSAGE